MFWITIGFIIQGLCGGGGMQGQMPTYLSERFPTEVRATAIAFCLSPRTTKLYDRTGDEITLDEVERITI